MNKYQTLIKACQVDLVVLDHPAGNMEVSFADWKAVGPGERKFLRPMAALAADGAPLSIRAIPLRYRNNNLSRALISFGVMKSPWLNNKAPR